MNIINLIAGFSISASCIIGTHNPVSQSHRPNPKELNVRANHGSPDSAKWNTNFLEFVSAITNNDQNKVKSFIDFPIRNEGNEIWYLADSKLVMKIDPNKIVPFTETDFDKYHSSIFPLDFRSTLQKLPTKDLFRKGKATSPDMEVVKGSTSNLTATYDKTKHKLTLKLVTLIKGAQGTSFDVIYEFDVLEDQQIKFWKVHVSG